MLPVAVAGVGATYSSRPRSVPNPAATATMPAASRRIRDLRTPS
jgi:hypothetical protein